MSKVVCLVALCFFISSCHPLSSSKDGKELVTSTDTMQSKNPAIIDTTEINIDAVIASPDKFKILLENEHVRVVQYSLKPGEKDNVHTHPPKTSYVISGGKLRVHPENEKAFDYDEVKGVTEWSGKRGKHWVENIGNTTVTILLTEIKSAQ